MRPIPSWSRTPRRAAALAAVALLAACSVFPQVATLDQARARLTGMTDSQVTACMGTPATTLTAPDGRTVWTYTPAPGAANVAPPVTDPGQATFGYTPFSGGVGGQSVAAAVAPPSRASCTLVLIFGRGQVAEVTYAGPNGGPPAQPEACGALAGRCLP